MRDPRSKAGKLRPREGKCLSVASPPEVEPGLKLGLPGSEPPPGTHPSSAMSEIKLE